MVIEMGETLMYCLPDGYQSREKPAYHDVSSETVLWQTDVYAYAFELASSLKAKTVIDIGCGDGRKLLNFFPEFNLIGVDYGENFERHNQLANCTWIECNLEDSNSHPEFSSDMLEESVIICADVIEHLQKPEILLDFLADCVDLGAALVLSSPERDLTHGKGNMGMPPNPCHVQEWNEAEFRCLLAQYHLEVVTFRIVPPYGGSSELSTMMAVIV
jgi:SAM-dependent methyltransferase